jgi:hypothetical protein
MKNRLHYDLAVAAETHITQICAFTDEKKRQVGPLIMERLLALLQVYDEIERDNLQKRLTPMDN